MSINSFRDLRVWRAEMDLVEVIYTLTGGFPEEETYGLTSQLRRAAVSIAANIAEGHAREHLKEYLHHPSMAQASLAELETEIEVAARLGYAESGQASRILDQAASLGRQLHALRNSLQRGAGGSTPGP